MRPTVPCLWWIPGLFHVLGEEKPAAPPQKDQASLAQWLLHLTLNQGIFGSSPKRGT